MNAIPRANESHADALSMDDDFSWECIVEPASFDPRSYARWAHGLWLVADAATLDAAIAGMRRRERHHPALWFLRGIKAWRSGDYALAIDYIGRAIKLASDDVRDYYLDTMFPLANSFGPPGLADEVLVAFNGAIPSMAPIVESARAILTASAGSWLDSRRASEAALAQLANCSPYVRARVAQRLGVAAYFRCDFSEAEMLSRQAQLAGDVCGLHRLSFAALSVLYLIEGYIKGSIAGTSALARGMLRASNAQEDRALARHLLISELGFAAERGDSATMSDMVSELGKNDASGDQQAMHQVRRCEALLCGWQQNFASAAVLLEMNLRTNGYAKYDNNGERALDQSLLAAVYLALDDLEMARRYARRAISGTVAPAKKHEKPDEYARRFRTRLIGALTSIALGDSVRGRRALSSAFVSSTEGRLPDIIDSAAAIFPSHLLGYARFIDAAHAHYKRHQVVALTKAERQVLAALDDGGTYATVAATLGKSAATVKMQCHSAYAKLGARDRVSALRRFREIREASR